MATADAPKKPSKKAELLMSFSTSETKPTFSVLKYLNVVAIIIGCITIAGQLCVSLDSNLPIQYWALGGSLVGAIFSYIAIEQRSI
jgi:hypothetical protein